MEEAISQTSKAFHHFQEMFLKSNILDHAPELGDTLHSTAKTILFLTQAIAPNQDIDNNNPALSPLKIQDSKADQEIFKRFKRFERFERFERLAAEEQRPDVTTEGGVYTAGVAQRRGISRHRPGKHISGNKPSDANTSESTKPFAEKTQGHSTSENGGRSITLKQQFASSLVTNHL
jgi:hypothetical protein